jgi:DNA-binding PadR family transcriptional regulator
MEEEFGSFDTELKRGFIQIIVLVALEKRMYGYGMIRFFEEIGYAVDESTLYPLLRRLEKNGWIASEWDVSEDRPKKFYRITDDGKAIRDRALAAWRTQAEILDRLMEVRREA